MGYGEYGGGGSIAWKVDVDDETQPGKKRASAFGRDAKNATRFKVSLEYASNGDAQADLARLKLKAGEMEVDGKRIIFEVAVQPENEDQIRVEWY